MGDLCIGGREYLCVSLLRVFGVALCKFKESVLGGERVFVCKDVVDSHSLAVPGL